MNTALRNPPRVPTYLTVIHTEKDLKIIKIARKRFTLIVSELVNPVLKSLVSVF